MPIPLPPAVPEAPGTPGVILQRRWARIGSDLFLGVADDYGTRVIITDLRGWEGASGTTGAVEQRSAADGGWANPAWLPPRIVQVDLAMNGADFMSVNQSLRRLVNRIPHNELTELLVVDHDFETRALVRQEGDVITTQKAATARVSLSLIAPDPRRYGSLPVDLATGLPQSSGGRRVPLRAPFSIEAALETGTILATNDGNIDTPPVLTVYGPCPPFTITHTATARTLRYHDTVPAGRTLVIDTAARTAALDGTAARYITGSWFTYAPGDNVIAFGAGSYEPDAVLTSTHRAAWK